MACGIGALLALERGDRRGDLICCALLVLALTFQTLGLVFVAAAAVAIAWDRELRSRAWVVLLPAALYVLWYLGWGRARMPASYRSRTSRPRRASSSTASRPRLVAARSRRGPRPR